jgi:CBS domain-containing protein
MNAIASSPLAAVSVQSVMARNLVTCSPSASQTDVAGSMTVHEVHAVVVDARSPRLVTALDVARAAVAGEQVAAERMASMPTSVAPSHTLYAVAEEMTAAATAHVLVTEDERAAGIVSSFDVAAVLAHHDPHRARIVRPAPARPEISSGRLDRHTVGDVMHRGIVQCPPTASLGQLAAALVEHRTHAIATERRGRRIFVSDMDVVAAALRGDVALQGADVGRNEPAMVVVDDSLAVAAALIARGDNGHVVVMDREGAAVGVLSAFDIVRVVAAG